MSEPKARDRFGKYTFVSTTYTAEKSRISFDMWNIGESECDQMIDKSLSPASFDVNHPNIVNICCIPLIDPKNEFSSSDHTTEYANDQFPSKCSGRAFKKGSKILFCSNFSRWQPHISSCYTKTRNLSISIVFSFTWEFGWYVKFQILAIFAHYTSSAQNFSKTTNSISFKLSGFDGTITMVLWAIQS